MGHSAFAFLESERRAHLPSPATARQRFGWTSRPRIVSQEPEDRPHANAPHHAARRGTSSGRFVSTATCSACGSSAARTIRPAASRSRSSATATRTTHTVLELTHNWDTERYELGNAYGHVALGVEDIYARCEELRDEGGEGRPRAGADEARRHRDRVHRGSRRVPDRADPARRPSGLTRLHSATRRFRPVAPRVGARQPRKIQEPNRQPHGRPRGAADRRIA